MRSIIKIMPPIIDRVFGFNNSVDNVEEKPIFIRSKVKFIKQFTQSIPECIEILLYNIE